MKKFIITALSLFLLIGLTSVQGAREAGPAVKFTSLYTDLNKECRSAMTKAEEEQAEKYGQDIPLVCKGYGGYEISLGSHGAMSYLIVKRKGAKEDEKAPVQEMLFISDPIYTRKVEWRLADGIPFAVIFRRDIYDDTQDPSERKKIGEVLRVAGLKDEKINFEVDVKKYPNANEEARRLADQAYSGGR